VTATLAFLLVVVLWVLVSGRLSRRSVTGPIALTLAGLLVARGFGIDIRLESETVKELIELTLAIVLFSDASTIGARWFATEWRYPARLLGIGLPLTILLGTLAALWIFPGTDVWVAFVVAAALAPTDAALGTSIIEDERIPLNFRQVINVESGLNDGLATPVVTFAIAGVIAADEGGGSSPLGAALIALAIAVAVGVLLGAITGRATAAAQRAGWALPALVPIVPLAVALGSYALVVALGGNGFVAAFVSGVAFGGTLKPEQHHERMELTEYVGLLLGFVVWFIFGAALLSRVLPDITWQIVAYAVLSLTVLRMLPVAISALGARQRWDTVALAGWLGPRGLASIVFAILALDDIGGEQGRFVVTVVAVTVALSVLAHGLSAGPLAGWYASRHPAEPRPVEPRPQPS
jgi:NhaP-type Na+/H+ or K+/H+ antiporter